MKMPPVLGWRATSPRERENVERSSCANLGALAGELGRLSRGEFEGE